MRSDWKKIDQANESGANDQNPRCETCDYDDLSRKLNLKIGNNVNAEHDDSNVRGHVEHGICDPEYALYLLAAVLSTKQFYSRYCNISM